MYVSLVVHRVQKTGPTGPTDIEEVDIEMIINILLGDYTKNMGKGSGTKAFRSSEAKSTRILVLVLLKTKDN